MNLSSGFNLSRMATNASSFSLDDSAEICPRKESAAAVPRLAAVVASVSVSIAPTSLLVAAAAAVVEEARREEGEDDKEEEREGGRPERGKVLWAVRPAFTGKPRSDGCP